jgi:hypothetical protein
VEIVQKYGTIPQVMALTGEAKNSVRSKLRTGRYKAVRDGKLLRIILQSVLDDLSRLPEVQFSGEPLPCAPQRQRASANSAEEATPK